MKDYNLGFISNIDIFTHVKNTVEQYKSFIDLAEFNNKHNTMNANSGQATMMKFLQKAKNDPNALCLLVEVIAKKSQDIMWCGTFRGVSLGDDERIRRMSIDRFYNLVFNDNDAFCKLCKALPSVLDDVIASSRNLTMNNTVYSELRELAPDIFKSLYLLAFKTYEGFDNF